MRVEPKKSKAQQAKEEVLAALDAADAEVVNNPGSVFEPNDQDGSFAELFGGTASDTTGEQFVSGKVVTGKVVDVQNDCVLVDINYKSEGLIPLSEFRLLEGQTVESGTEVEVYIDKVENENGMIILSKDKADMQRAWADISKAAENGEVVKGTVIAKVKGGLSVDIGVKAFLPGSQIDLRPVRNMDMYLGKTYDFKVIKFNKRRGNVVLSRRALLEVERESLKSQTLDSMKEGSIVKGVVKNITEYGSFVDLGGMDGLLHITDMSWGRIKCPTEVVTVGDEIEVKILKYDPEKQRVSLGLKQLKSDPWEEVTKGYPQGRKMEGQVVSLAEYGAFVNLEEGVEGLIHVKEMSWTKRIKHSSQILKVGDTVEVVVLEIDAENRRISLSMKQLQDNPWSKMKDVYPPGTIIEGEVKSIADFGVFVGIEGEVDGLVHISDFSWSKHIGHPSEAVTKGDKIRVVVLGVDTDNERFSLGIKQLEPDPWEVIEDKYPIGSQHDVKVTRLAEFGVFVELESNIEGLIHISELSTKRIETSDEVCQVGDTLKAEILTIDKESRKIGLSVKLVALRGQHTDADAYAKKAAAAAKGLGGVLGEALDAARKQNEDDDE